MPLSEAALALIDNMNARTPKVGSEVMDAGVARKILSVNPPAAPTISLERVKDLNGGTGDGGPPITIRMYEANAMVTRRPLLVFAHGGGWVLGGLDSHDAICRRLARDTGAVIASVDFGRAPEHRFPGPVQDVYAAITWLHTHAGDLGLDPDRIAIAGDSSGGNLAGAAVLMARDHGGPELTFQVLLYPVTDHRLDSRSYREFGETGGFLTQAKMQWYWNQYLGDGDRSDPYVSLVDAELNGLPRTLIVVAECDPLRDEGTSYAELLRAAGNDVTAVEYEGAFHGFLSVGEAFDVADRAARDIGIWIKESFARTVT